MRRSVFQAPCFASVKRFADGRQFEVYQRNVTLSPVHQVFRACDNVDYEERKLLILDLSETFICRDGPCHGRSGRGGAEARAR